MKPTLIVLAAGMGSRYGSLKQIDPFGPSGETIIDYSVHDAIKAGFGKVVFVIRKTLLKEFEELYFDKFSSRVEVDYVFQELDNVPEGIVIPEERQKPWGTGHAVLVARDKVKEPFAVVNADDFYGYSSFELMANQLCKMPVDKLGACMVGFMLNNTLSENGYVSRGVCEVNADDSLKSITERTRITRKEDGVIYFEEGDTLSPLAEETTVSMNLIGFTPPVFDLMEKGFTDFIQEKSTDLKAEFYIPTVLHQVAGLQAVPVLKSEEKWLGVTYKEDKPVVKKLLTELVEAEIYPTKLW